MKRHCDNCRFYHDPAELGEGECRRNSPPVSAAMYGYAVTWPRVEQHDFCGDWTPIGQPRRQPRTEQR